MSRKILQNPAKKHFLAAAACYAEKGDSILEPPEFLHIASARSLLPYFQRKHRQLNTLERFVPLFFVVN
ncbi:MAG: hypothetical protein LUH20_12210, partial [Lachnospiraceae bacterium]|nr:hypothetical protein [Lachnospiraceae bacterium]